MKKNCLFFLCIITLFSWEAKAQEKLELSQIADSLKAGAYSVVRENNLEFVCESEVSGMHKEKLVLTVLNANGADAANFIYSADKFRELVKFGGAIYDASGNLIRKVKLADLEATEYSAELASDSKTYYYDCSVASYPYTVVYEWEVRFKNAIVGFPVFVPQSSYNQSLEKASYKIVVPLNIDPLCKVTNMMAAPEKKTNEKSKTFEWNLSNLHAVEQEAFAQSLTSFVPFIYAVPRNFIFDKTRGDMSNWNTFGKWQYNLLKERDALPEAFKIKLVELTKDCKTDKEKVKVVYDYLGSTTRYVSIQLGIGGLQPIAASEVNRTGFGDCKGLSNYMCAMLNELKIPSVYTVVSTNNARLTKDFASANQMNHVILQVPLPKDTLWLECTNPKLPFGFVHRDIAGHDALLIKENGGELYRLPSYPDSLNKESLTINISLNGEGGGSLDVTQNSHLFQYEVMHGFTELDAEKQAEYLRREIDLTQGKVNNISCKELKSGEPSLITSFRLDYDNYSTKTGNRLFVPVNIFRHGVKNLSTKKRIHPLLITYGYADSDTITLQIPDNYSIEALPKTATIEQPFGRFNSTVKTEDGKIIVIQRLYLKAGTYDATLYPDFTKFWVEVTKSYGNKIILKKKE